MRRSGGLPTRVTSDVTALGRRLVLLSHVISVSKKKRGRGVISGRPTHDQLLGGSRARFVHGSSATLHAVARASSMLAGLDRILYRNARTADLTVDGDKMVAARFDLRPYAVTVERSGGGAGIVVKHPGWHPVRQRLQRLLQLQERCLFFAPTLARHRASPAGQERAKVKASASSSQERTPVSLPASNPVRP